MAEVTMAEAMAQVRRTIGAYRDRVHGELNPPENIGNGIRQGRTGRAPIFKKTAERAAGSKTWQIITDT